MKISFAEFDLSRSGAIVVGVWEGGELTRPARQIDEASGGAVARALAGAGRFRGKKRELLAIVGPAGIAASQIVLAGLGKPDEADARTLQDLGGTLVAHLNSAGEKAATVAVDLGAGAALSEADASAQVAFGAALRAYRFDRYRTTEKPERKPTLAKLTVTATEPNAAKRAYRDLDAAAESVAFARDLISEPANVIYPETFAERAESLTELGLKVEILDEKQLKKLGMGALLGVGQGSARPSRVVVLQWNGGADGAAPLAFVGKGVTFDTGGISIKPAAGMEDMKGDLAGAACVTGLIQALAVRKAKVNAVGVIGLVENMPDGNAQRPGDIVTSMSGQTIEIINTDAEGRLVLADVLWYAAKRFKPRFMVDLATLTGAIIVALGQEYAGMFSNDDKLCERLTKAGELTGELVWRMPLSAAYDKMIDSKFADMKNTGGSRWGGAITAAQFIQRHVADKTPWAHLDIAGTGFDSRQSDINKSWGSGWGVRLLDRLVADYYER